MEMMRVAFAEGSLRVVGIGGSAGLDAFRRALAASEDKGVRVEQLHLTELKSPMYEPRKPLDEYVDDVRRRIEAIREADERGDITDDSYVGRPDRLVVELAQKLRAEEPSRAEPVGAVA